MSGEKTLRSKHYAAAGAVGDWMPEDLNPPAPEDGMRLRVTVEDAEGLSCDTGRWPLRNLRRMDASVWVVHDKAESVHLTDRGRGTRAAEKLWARFCRGEELTIVATGPDADEALGVCAEMAALDVSERKGFYRDRYSAKRAAGSRRRACEVCGHPERDAIDAELLTASPRHVRKGRPELSRAALVSHRDGCGVGAKGGDSETTKGGA